MRILIAGDLHGSFQAARALRTVALREEVDMVWQVGDFGFWPRIKDGVPTRDFLAILAGVPVPIIFADGNHEDHEALESDRRGIGFVDISDNVYHARRGTVLELEDGTRTIFLGGAVSVDREWRTPGHDWFASERPSRAQLVDALETIDRDPIDYVVAHDVPGWVDFGYPPIEHAFWPAAELRASEHLRQEFTYMADVFEPAIWFGGHHHVRKSDGFNGTRVEVLNCDGLAGTFVVLDTQKATVEDVLTSR